MPTKGSKLKYGNRDYIINQDFYKKVIDNNPDLQMSYKDVVKILRAHTKIIAEVVEEEIDGFKVPKGLGYLCALKYISTKPSVDWKKTKDIGKTVYHTNFDTFGYSSTVKLFKVGRPNNNSFYDIFMFKPCKKLFQSIVRKFKSGKVYSDYTTSDFIEKSRLENLYSKKFRKDLKK